MPDSCVSPMSNSEKLGRRAKKSAAQNRWVGPGEPVVGTQKGRSRGSSRGPLAISRPSARSICVRGSPLFGHSLDQSWHAWSSSPAPDSASAISASAPTHRRRRLGAGSLAPLAPFRAFRRKNIQANVSYLCRTAKSWDGGPTRTRLRRDPETVGPLSRGLGLVGTGRKTEQAVGVGAHVGAHGATKGGSFGSPLATSRPRPLRRQPQR